jgi:hypothetical protein
VDVVEEFIFESKAEELQIAIDVETAMEAMLLEVFEENSEESFVARFVPSDPLPSLPEAKIVATEEAAPLSAPSPPQEDENKVAPEPDKEAPRNEQERELIARIEEAEMLAAAVLASDRAKENKVVPLVLPRLPSQRQFAGYMTPRTRNYVQSKRQTLSGALADSTVHSLMGFQSQAYQSALETHLQTAQELDMTSRDVAMKQTSLRTIFSQKLKHAEHLEKQRNKITDRKQNQIESLLKELNTLHTRTLQVASESAAEQQTRKLREQKRNIRNLRRMETELFSQQAEEDARKRFGKDADPELVEKQKRLAKAAAFAQTLKSSVELRRHLEAGDDLSAVQRRLQERLTNDQTAKASLLAAQQKALADVQQFAQSSSEPESDAERRLGRRLGNREKQEKEIRRTGRQRERALARSRLHSVSASQYKELHQKVQTNAQESKLEFRMQRHVEKMIEDQARQREEAEKKRQSDLDEIREVEQVIDGIIWEISADERVQNECLALFDDLYLQVEVADTIEKRFITPLENREAREAAEDAMSFMIQETEYEYAAHGALESIIVQLEAEEDKVWVERAHADAYERCVNQLVVEFAMEIVKDAEIDATVEDTLSDIVQVLLIVKHGNGLGSRLSIFKNLTAESRRRAEWAMKRLRPKLRQARVRVAKKSQAARVIQRTWMRRVVFHRVVEERIKQYTVRAAIKIQAFWRGYHSRRLDRHDYLTVSRLSQQPKLWALYLSATNIESNRKEAVRQYSALRIQRTWRGWRVRRRVFREQLAEIKREAAAFKIQKAFKSRSSRRLFKRVQHKIITLQRVFRGMRPASDKKTGLRRLALEMESGRSKSFADLLDEVESRSAVKIQTCYRAWKARRLYKSLRIAKKRAALQTFIELNSKVIMDGAQAEQDRLRKQIAEAEAEHRQISKSLEEEAQRLEELVKQQEQRASSDAELRAKGETEAQERAGRLERLRSQKEFHAMESQRKLQAINSRLEARDRKRRHLKGDEDEKKRTAEQNAKLEADRLRLEEEKKRMTEQMKREKAEAERKAAERKRKEDEKKAAKRKVLEQRKRELRKKEKEEAQKLEEVKRKEEAIKHDVQQCIDSLMSQTEQNFAEWQASGAPAEMDLPTLSSITVVDEETEKKERLLKQQAELERKQREYAEAIARLKQKKHAEERKMQMNERWEHALRVFKSGEASIGDLYSITSDREPDYIEPPSMDDLLPGIYDHNGGKRERRAPTQPPAAMIPGAKPRAIAAAQVASPRRRQPLMGGKKPAHAEEQEDTCSIM